MKTHTFRNGRYKVSKADRIDGMCDVPDSGGGLNMLILDGCDFKALNSALHEAMHADGIPDKYLHDGEGYSDTERISRFLWRLGYRMTESVE